MCFTRGRQHSWLPAVLMLVVFWFAFTNFEWWWLFFIFWFVMPFSRVWGWHNDEEENGDVIVVDKRKNSDKRGAYLAQPSESDRRYIRTEDGEWLEII